MLSLRTISSKGHKFVQEVRLCFVRNASNFPKTGIVLLNMGGPQKIEQVHNYLNQIMTDRDMIQLPFAQECEIIF
jgi:hypothetical protein